jgi:hypothetical protein
LSTAPITLRDIGDRLVGLDNWREAAHLSKSKYTDETIVRTIPAWIRLFEQETTFTVYPVQIVSAPDGTYDTPATGAGTLSCQGDRVTGTGTAFTSFFAPGQLLRVGNIKIAVASVEDDTHLTLDDEAPTWRDKPYQKHALPVVMESGYPYFPDPDASEYFVTTFRKRPIITVQRMRFMFNGKILIYTVPPEWHSVNERSGRFWLLPYYGSLAISSAAAAAALYSVMLADHLPNFLFFDYQAGLPEGWQYEHEWRHLRLMLAKFCALQILKDIDQSISAGVQSKSASGAGINQTLSFDRFVAKKQELQDEINAFSADFKAQQTPFMLSSI